MDKFLKKENLKFLKLIKYFEYYNNIKENVNNLSLKGVKKNGKKRAL